MLDHQLGVGDAVELVGDEAIRRAHPRRQWGGGVELDSVEYDAAAPELELQVFVLDEALRLDFKLVEKARFGKALAPDRGLEQARGLQVQIAGFDRAVGF